VDGKPRYWNVSSADAYPLADGTWFASGHYGAYLGGYDDAYDILWQVVFPTIPANATTAELHYSWYMTTTEYPSSVYDKLDVRLRNIQWEPPVATLQTITNLSTSNQWVSSNFDLRPYSGQTLYLSFEADTDSTFPTSFFVDDVSLWICGP
jgi:hypothetical protein